MPGFLSWMACLGILAGVGLAPLRAQDDEEAALRRALGERAFRENCLICHGPEMTTSQRLSAEQWKAEMTKMIGWGAPVPADQVGDLTDWLIAEFPPGKPVDPPSRVRATELGGASAPEEVAGDGARARDTHGAALYAQHCANCHGADAQGGDLGPILVERPVLVHPDEWGEVVLSGRRRMPGYAEVLSPGQSDAIRAWLTGRTYTAAR
jgi:mono/diheme cytochrome c family protein